LIEVIVAIAKCEVKDVDFASYLSLGYFSIIFKITELLYKNT